MPCPCGNQEDRNIVKNGVLTRKKKTNVDGETGPKVQRYLCTVCGYTARGSVFGLPEEVKGKKER